MCIKNAQPHMNVQLYFLWRIRHPSFRDKRLQLRRWSLLLPSAEWFTKPIGFICKSLHGAELQPLEKGEYLLRDIQFALKTDHDYLIKLKSMNTTD